MKSFLRWIACSLWISGGIVFAQASETVLTAESSGPVSEWTFSYNKQTVMVYAFAPGQSKPYVREFAPLGGGNILRDSPSDHRHHHALMYGIKVNGLNFWEETPGNGIQKVIETSKPQITPVAPGLTRAVIRQRLHWVSATNAFLPDTTAAALLIEDRTLTLTVDEAGHEVALVWDAAFEVGANAGTVQLEGATYHGLGMRFQKPLDSIARHFWGGGAPDLGENRQDVSSHAWEAVSFDNPGKPATIALFGLPSNPAGEAHFFSMRTPFAYLSATQGLDSKPLTYHGGDKFHLRYLVTLHPEIQSSESLQKRAEKWTADNP
jgi:hypothetical protein